MHRGICRVGALLLFACASACDPTSDKQSETLVDSGGAHDGSALGDGGGLRDGADDTHLPGQGGEDAAAHGGSNDAGVPPGVLQDGGRSRAARVHFRLQGVQ